MATKKHRYMISVDDTMFQQIEDFRYVCRYPTRSEATAKLLNIALESIKADSKKENHS